MLKYGFILAVCLLAPVGAFANDADFFDAGRIHGPRVDVDHLFEEFELIGGVVVDPLDHMLLVIVERLGPRESSNRE